MWVCELPIVLICIWRQKEAIKRPNWRGQGVVLLLYSHIINMLIYTYTYIYICWIHNDAMNNDETIIKQTSEGFFIKICTSLFIVRVRKGYSRFYSERELETEQNCNILTPTLMAVSVVSCSFSRAAQPEAQGPSSLLDDGFLYCILSPTGLVPKLHQGSRGPLRPGVAFPTTSYQQFQLSHFLS